MRFARFFVSFWTMGLVVASGGCGGSSSSLPAPPSILWGSSWTARSAGSSVKEKILYDFPASGQGAHPGGNLAYDRAGSLYATTSDGGATCGQFVCGTIVKFSDQGGRYTSSVVYRFHNNGDGYSANSGLIVDATGTIYGTSSCCYYGQKGGGVLFKLTPARKGYEFKTLFAFSGAGPYPNGGLIVDRTGTFFATAYQGGASGFGAVFELKPAGSGYVEITLYSFSGGADGANPAVGLTAGASGELYGTTAFGGQQTCNQGAGCGVVYELTPEAVGYKESVLYAFGGDADGNEPFAAVVRDAKGNLFGTTQFGGGAPSCPDGCGTVYELKRSSSSYTESVLYNFSGTGYNPTEPVIVNRAGAIYGTTQQGGSANNGTVFKLTPSGSGYVESDAYLFQGPPRDGEYPNALTIGKKGRLFGTTIFGGSGPASQCGNDLGCGVVFELRGERART